MEEEYELSPSKKEMNINTRLLFSLCVAFTFCILLSLNPLPGQVENIKLFFITPLYSLDKFAYVFALPVFLFSLFLGKLLPSTNSGTTRDKGFFFFTTIFWGFSALAWLGGSLDDRLFLLALFFGALFGMIERLYRSSSVSYWVEDMEDNSLTTEAKIELLKQASNKKLALFLSLAGITITCEIASLKELEHIYSNTNMLGIPLTLWLGFWCLKALQESSQIRGKLIQLYDQKHKKEALTQSKLDKLYDYLKRGEKK